jgi:dihydrolipoamide dehydrogenase
MKEVRDIIIIGGGVAGITAAIRSAQNGLNVTLVEKEKIGGVHVNWGGIPTKSLLSIVEIIRRVRDSKRLGLVGEVSIDWEVLQKHRIRVCSQIVRFNELALKNNGVEVIYGEGELVSPSEVRVLSKEGRSLETQHVLLAMGSHNITIPGIPLGRNILDSDQAIQLKKLPESILIIGGGAVGLEFATIFTLLGSRVIIVELLQRLLPNEEQDVGVFIEKRLEKEGVQILVKSKVIKVEESENGVKVNIDTPKGERIESVEKVLMAVGRKPNIDTDKLNALQVKTNRQGIIVNDRMQTTVPNVYAAGDVIGKHLLLNVAMKEAKVAAGNIAGGDEKIDYNGVPRCVFTIPEIATVGVTEHQTKEKVIVVKDPFFSPRAAGAGEVEGFIKIIAKQDGTIIGAIIVGAHASELIQPLSQAVRKRTNALELADSFYPSPTFSEAVMNVLGKVEGKAIFGFG